MFSPLVVLEFNRNPQLTLGGILLHTLLQSSNPHLPLKFPRSSLFHFIPPSPSTTVSFQVCSFPYCLGYWLGESNVLHPVRQHSRLRCLQRVYVVRLGTSYLPFSIFVHSWVSRYPSCHKQAFHVYA